ncbi:hypothetical protein KY345_04340 [Candidatus Woesearchaeota archaeon]|nr:hypothetical protein [Candidatus Woesearchaeota archaeon]
MMDLTERIMGLLSGLQKIEESSIYRTPKRLAEGINALDLVYAGLCKEATQSNNAEAITFLDMYETKKRKVIEKLCPAQEQREALQVYIKEPCLCD